MTIDRQTTIGQVLGEDRGTAPIFMRYGMHCLGCPGATSESIERACAVHGTSVDALIEELNAYFEKQ